MLLLFSNSFFYISLFIIYIFKKYKKNFISFVFAHHNLKSLYIGDRYKQRDDCLKAGI